MKSSSILVLCTFSSLTVFAELPAPEETPSSFTPFLLTDDDDSLEENFSMIDENWEDFEKELNVLEMGAENREKNSDTLEAMQSEIKAPTIDIAKPLENIENTFSLEIIEEKKAQPLSSAADTSAASQSALVLQTAPEGSQDFSSLSLEEADSSTLFPIQSSSQEIKSDFDVQLDLKRAFSGSPIIYTILLAMSVFSIFIWVYSILSLKKRTNLPQTLLNTLHSNLNSNHFDEALSLCHSQDALLCKMVASGIQSRKYGLSVMVESMKAEGKRASMSFWQKIGLLNDIAILAPMLGLLGTVLGMFYAFYDVNRSIESITSLFDGLGISVGTTVAGLVVAILALILHSTAKYRLIQALSQVEAEAHTVTALIDNHTSLYETK